MTGSVSYIFKAIDGFSDVANKINGKIKSIEHSAEKAAIHLKNMGQTTRRVGQEMTLFLDVPIAFATKESIEAYTKAETALSQINLTLKNTHNAAGFTAEQLQKMDKALSDKSLFTQSQILNGVTNILLRFKSIHGATFEQAQKSIIEYAQATGVSLSLATKTIGAIIENPMQGLLRLKRQGIVFTQVQQKAIEQLVKTGHLGEAQQAIFKRLAIFQGSSAAALKTNAGQMKEFNKNLEELKESFGEILVKYLLPFLKHVNVFIQYLEKLSPTTKKWIVIIAASIAIFSVVITYIGILLMSLGAVIETFKVLAVIEWAALSIWVLAAAAIAFFAYEMYRAYESGNTLKYAIYAIAASVTTLLIAIKLGLGPIGWIISAIQLVGLGFAYAYKHSERFRSLISRIISELKPFTKELMNIVTLLEKFGGIAFNAAYKFFGGTSPAMARNTNQSAITSQMLLSQNQSKVDINLHVNDKNNVIKSINAKPTGNTNVNLGRNMAFSG